MRNAAFTLALALASTPFAFGLDVRSYAVKETVAVPTGWKRVAAAPSNHKIKLQIGLYQENFESLERQLWEVSDPSHQNYGQHLSKEEVEALVAPHPDALDAVDEWLEAHGIDLDQDVSRSPARDWVTITVPVSLAEALFDTEYSVWQHDSGASLVRTTHYSLPKDLHAHVEVAQPTTSFALFRRMGNTHHFEPEEEDAAPSLVASAAADGTVVASTGQVVNASCNVTITPQCLYDLYNIHYTGSARTKNSIATANYLEEYVNFTDLNTFYKTYVPGAVGSPKPPVYLINGGLNNQSDPGGEAALDAQYAFGLAYPAKPIVYSTGGSPPWQPANNATQNTNEPYAEWQEFVLKQKKSDIPLIVSTSYGDDEFTVPKSYAKRVCAGFAQLGARGISVFFSSGDGGVGDGEANSTLTDCPGAFAATFPASCPYVTAVGGTRYVDEIGVAFSGGGFSSYFPRPLYQTLAVLKAKSNIPKGVYQGRYNAAGRAFPDLSAQAVRFQVFIGDRVRNISGTSASAPAIAGIFAKLNDQRLKAHLPPLGFVNPLIYSGNGYGFFDIKKGNNPVSCGTPGFNATPGYDLVTGFGTPNFPQLEKLVHGRRD